LPIAEGWVDADQTCLARGLARDPGGRPVLVLTSIQEASATIFLTLGGWEMMPFGIFTFCIAGSQSQATALGVVLIAMCALSLYVVNRIAGTRVGGLFG
jgi:ABC-type Fe3+ transport system permease subunit